MKIALITGINYYEHGGSLHGCVNDAYNVKAMLERNDGGTVNFDCKLMVADNERDQIVRGELKDAIAALFNTNAETVLFYFAGHGHLEATGGYLLTSEVKRGDDGVQLGEILTMANNSPARNKIIILDSCHSGIAGNAPTTADVSTIKEGVTILTASIANAINTTFLSAMLCVFSC